MTPRTLTAPPTDKGMWRRLLARVHPDVVGGDHDLFVWVQGLHEHVAGDSIEPIADARPRRARYRGDAPASQERVPFDYYAADHEALTSRAVAMGVAAAVAEPFAFLLRLLSGCYPVEDGPLHDQQKRGATYRTLAAIAYKVGMDRAERIQWYRVAESIPLSQRHAGHIIARLQERGEGLS